VEHATTEMHIARQQLNPEQRNFYEKNGMNIRFASNIACNIRLFHQIKALEIHYSHKFVTI
jgi:hypothetical protein